MNNKTKRTLIFASLTFVLISAASLFLYNEIKAQGLLIEEQIAILNENNGKEATFNHLTRVVQDTEEERAQIADLFFHNESDSIEFLNEIETLAPSFGLEFKTEALEKSKDEATGHEVVRMSFSYVGKKSAVLGFTKMMESIPYHSEVKSLSIKEHSTGEYEGKSEILITIQPI